MKIVIAGNPNAGKTTLFNALTKSRLKTGNWHGVTTLPYLKEVDGNTFVDVPGTYSLTALSMEEVGAIREIESADVIINVVDATTLENALHLTGEILKLNDRVIVFLSKVDLLKKRGGKIDVSALSNYLGVEVITDVKNLKNATKNFAPFVKTKVVKSLSSCYICGRIGLSFADKPRIDGTMND